MFVFDLDFTIWNCGETWLDHTQPPFHKEKGVIVDAQGKEMRLYPEVKLILNQIRDAGYKMAVASRTNEPDWAKQLIRLHELDHFFDYLEIYPGSKAEHFRNLHIHSGIDYEDMVFFDDDSRNIDEVKILGVNAFLIPEGLTHDTFLVILKNLSLSLNIDRLGVIWGGM